MPPTAILDVDGTLVDTNYHHAIAWFRALRDHGELVPVWRVHRHIGMGGDQLVAAVCGDAVEEEKGDEVRAAEGDHFAQLIDEAEPLHGARDLILDLKRRDHAVILASSAKPDEVDHYLDLLEARDLVDGWTTAGDVEATKPEPDLVLAAIEKAGGGEAVMVGDSTFDCESAARAGVPVLAVLTGGFSEQELKDAGAEAVFHSIDDLRADIDSTPLAR